MTIDYDRLRELADKAPPGPWEVKAEETIFCDDLIEGLVAWIESDNGFVFGRGMEIEEDEELTNLALAALAPDMARELLRLRDGVEVIRDHCATLAKRAKNAGIRTLAREMDTNAKALTGLLNGDTE